MVITSFPAKIQNLEPYSERFQAFRLAASGCDVLFATYPAGTKLEPHSHETDNWGVILKGEMSITIDQKTVRFGPGDWYHVPAYKVHSAYCESLTEEIEFWFASRSS